MRKTVSSVALVIVLLAISFGCSRKPSNNDDTIVKDIQQKVAADPETKDTNVVVAAKDGQVTLTGKATAPAARQKVEQIAQAEPGVSKVDDQIVVEEAPPAMATHAAPSAAEAAQAAPPPPMEKPKPKPIVIPAGTVVDVTLADAISSKTAQPGDPFSGTLATPIAVNGKTVIPAGSRVSGKVVDAKAKGRFKGEAKLQLAVTSITARGKTYLVQATMAGLTEKGKGKRTAATTGGGAAGGALIGGLAGGGKGAGIGALIGAGVGLAGGAFTGNKQIELPAESQISFRLASPVKLGTSQEAE